MDGLMLSTVMLALRSRSKAQVMQALLWKAVFLPFVLDVVSVVVVAAAQVLELDEGPIFAHVVLAQNLPQGSPLGIVVIIADIEDDKVVVPLVLIHEGCSISFLANPNRVGGHPR